MELHALSIAARSPRRLEEFWGSLLDGTTPGFPITFRPVTAPKTIPNRMHFDLTSTSPSDQRDIVDRALALGARHHDAGQGPDATHVVLADPEGNEFCVIEPYNTFLAGCGPIGAISSDGTQQAGYFWNKALDWPLVWDQDQETAIQSPAGGTKITWGGPPLPAKDGPNRWRFDLEAADAGELDRLLDLGAVLTSRDTTGWASLLDPDDNEFRVRIA